MRVVKLEGKGEREYDELCMGVYYSMRGEELEIYPAMAVAGLPFAKGDTPESTAKAVLAAVLDMAEGMDLPVRYWSVALVDSVEVTAIGQKKRYFYLSKNSPERN